MVEPLDGIPVLRLRAEELGSALEGYLEGYLEACKLFDHDDEQHNDRDSDFVLNLNGENVLIPKDSRLYLTRGESGTMTASIKMMRSSRVTKHTKFH